MNNKSYHRHHVKKNFSFVPKPKHIAGVCIKISTSFSIDLTVNTQFLNKEDALLYSDKAPIVIIQKVFKEVFDKQSLSIISNSIQKDNSSKLYQYNIVDYYFYLPKNGSHEQFVKFVEKLDKEFRRHSIRNSAEILN